jgi:hypothetical protein
MIFVCGFLALSTLLLAVCLVYTASFFLKREGVLIDRLLKQAGVQPVVIEREKVVKLPDPEIQPMTWQDEAFFIDDIKEELEQSYPEIARMSHSEAKARYAHEWMRVQKRLQAERTPLRAD